jgi:enoyl-[acyl-carrier protein] reductase/trans-2-enoyl-CoA reductase (NAD+)
VPSKEDTVVIKPMIRGGICMNAHPEGSELLVRKQIDYVKSHGGIPGPKNALVIGASGGYGLASRITAAFGAGAGTLGIAFEKPASKKRTATSGWYATHAFDRYAEEAGLTAETIIDDAFSHETRRKAVERIRELFGTVDLVVYSLASGVRRDPDTGETYYSALKPIGEPFTATSLDPMKETLSQVTLQPAGQEEIDATVKVMGGEDWQLWLRALQDAGVLSEAAVTVAYSYIGPELTRPMYRDGTIGRAKDHLERTASAITEDMAAIGGRAYVSINKAIVSKASAVIPVVPLYMSTLFRVMKEKGLHEGPIEQMHRLFRDRLYAAGVETDEQGRIRMDDYEMREDVQEQVGAIWPTISEENIKECTDLAEYQNEFLHIHGFGFPEIDYEKDVEP